MPLTILKNHSYLENKETRFHKYVSTFSLRVGIENLDQTRALKRIKKSRTKYNKFESTDLQVITHTFFNVKVDFFKIGCVIWQLESCISNQSNCHLSLF